MFVCLTCGNQMNPDELDENGNCGKCHSTHVIEMSEEEYMEPQNNSIFDNEMEEYEDEDETENCEDD